jgi:pSer/pThr/pTyr-binding forkhead associated (FHA) protein
MLRCLNNNRAYNLQELFELKDDRTLRIGRHIDNDIGSDSEESTTGVVYTAPSTVSRHHAQLKIDAGIGQLVFTPNQTANGTWCNSQSIPPGTAKVLSPGDIISLGGDPESTLLEERWTFVVADGVLEMLSRLTSAPRTALAATQVVDGIVNPVVVGNGTGTNSGKSPLVASGSGTHRETSGTRRVIATAIDLPPSSAARRGQKRQSSSQVIDLTGDSDEERQGRVAREESRIHANLKAEIKASIKAALEKQQQQHTKRPKSSNNKKAQIQIEEEPGPSEAGPSSTHPSPPAAAPAATTQEEVAPTAAPAPATSKNNNNNISANVQGHFTCPICQELLVATHSMVPCGHNYCGECLAGWVVNKKECPQCRQKGTSAPIKSKSIDNVIDEIANSISDEDKEARAEKKASWESGRARFEAALKAPWAAGGGGGGGGSRRGRGPAVAFRGDTFDLSAALFGLAGMDDMIMRDGRRGGVRVLDRQDGPGAAAALAAAQRRAAAALISGQQTFRVEYCSRNPRLTVLGTCGSCNGAFVEGQLKFGQRARSTAAATRNAVPWKWMHLPCVSSGAWSEAATNGVENLRNIAPADQATVRGFLARRR